MLKVNPRSRGNVASGVPYDVEDRRIAVPFAVEA